MKKVVIIATGGTISASGKDRLDFKDYQSGSFTLTEMIDQLPEIRENAQIVTFQLKNFSSTNLTPAHWLQLKKLTEEYLADPEIAGVVITHGTSTLEETAYFLHLTVNSSKPVILTGSQRPFTALGSDAGINLLQSVRVALAPESIGKGVLVVLNGQISSAREVTKTSKFQLETFHSGQLGFLGSVDVDGTVQYYRQPTRRHTVHSEFAQLEIKELPEVAILYSYVGMKPDLIYAVMEQKMYRGIVIATMGAARLSNQEKEALEKAMEQGIQVVLGSRIPEGRVVAYAESQTLPFIWGDNLLPHKARILLMLSLLKSDHATEIQAFFDQY